MRFVLQLYFDWVNTYAEIYFFFHDIPSMHIGLVSQ